MSCHPQPRIVAGIASAHPPSASAPSLSQEPEQNPASLSSVSHRDPSQYCSKGAPSNSETRPTVESAGPRPHNWVVYIPPELLNDTESNAPTQSLGKLFIFITFSMQKSSSKEPSGQTVSKLVANFIRELDLAIF